MGFAADASGGDRMVLTKGGGGFVGDEGMEHVEWLTNSEGVGEDDECGTEEGGGWDGVNCPRLRVEDR